MLTPGSVQWTYLPGMFLPTQFFKLLLKCLSLLHSKAPLILLPPPLSIPLHLFPPLTQPTKPWGFLIQLFTTKSLHQRVINFVHFLPWPSKTVPGLRRWSEVGEQTAMELPIYARHCAKWSPCITHLNGRLMPG